MRFFTLFIFTMLSLQMSAQNIQYPDTKRDLQVQDDYFGTIVNDPYRWLEDDRSKETAEWVKAQNNVTFDYLENIPFRKDIKDRLTELMDYEKVSAPFKEGDFYYYFKNDGLQNQSVLYRTKELGEDGELVLDPNTLSEDGTTSLGGMSFDKTGKYLAYSISEGGSDWRTAFVLNLENFELTDDKVEWIKFSGMNWFQDGFFYSRYPEPSGDSELSGQNRFHKVYYHKLGTDQSEDQLIWEDKEHENRNFYAQTTEDESLLIIGASESTSGNALMVKDLRKKDSPMITIVDDFKNDYGVVDNNDDKLLVLTNHEASNQKLIQIDINNPSKENWKEIIPESNDLLSGVSVLGGKLFLKYIHNASSLVKVYEPNGTFIQDLKLPGIGSVSSVSGKKKDTDGFFSFTSYVFPSTIFKLNSDDLTYEEYDRSGVDFDSKAYTTEQKWFTSKDGTKVPMFITYKKGIELDGQNPTLLYGYGGFNVSLTPGFSTTRIPLLENGGIYVVANLRGGGEFGSKWHRAGTLGEKQNVFDDFKAAAEYLIENKYTSSEKLAIEGHSNGGLLVGAAITQSPDLYAVAFPGVGVLDMLRYHKFTIGWAWATDYGKSDDKEAFEYLYKYSPLHNVKKADYPATMVVTADHDDRVVPAHSFKFISELQHGHTGVSPVLIRIETSAGHGAGKPISKIIEERADMLAFMLYNMGETYKIR